MTTPTREELLKLARIAGDVFESDRGCIDIEFDDHGLERFAALHAEWLSAHQAQGEPEKCERCDGLGHRMGDGCPYCGGSGRAFDSEQLMPITGGRESVDDAIKVIESFGPSVVGLNDTFARQVLLATEIKRLRSQTDQVWNEAVEAAEALCDKIAADASKRVGPWNDGRRAGAYNCKHAIRSLKRPLQAQEQASPAAQSGAVDSQPSPVDFDTWQEHPYTKALQDSIRNDYVPKDSQSSPVTDELPPLPEPLEIDWPELLSQALVCGVEDRGIRDRYEAAEYGWQDGVDKAIERVPEEIFDADQVREAQREAYELGLSRAQSAQQAQPVSDDIAALLRDARDSVRKVGNREDCIDHCDLDLADSVASRIDALLSQSAAPSEQPAAQTVVPDEVEQFLSEVRAELKRARAKFPGDRIMTIALAEEFGELCKAVLDESAANVRKEAVQTAVMAARVVLDGDGSVKDWRIERGLDPLVAAHPQAAQAKGGDK